MIDKSKKLLFKSFPGNFVQQKGKVNRFGVGRSARTTETALS